MTYDVLIIGAGPAGMMAAIQAGRQGKKVLLLEKNNRAGVKLMITGHGRANFTNVGDIYQTLVRKYGPNGKFLFSALKHFGPTEVMNFFQELGMESKVEDNGRVFPKSDKAVDLRDILLLEMKKNKVIIKFDCAIKKILVKNKKIVGMVGNDEVTDYATDYVIATGGKSYSATGSTGEMFILLKKIGHTIVKPRPSLTPIVCENKFIKRLQGLSFSNLKITLFKKKEKVTDSLGDLLFTGNGVSGPVIVNLSRFLAREDNLTDCHLQIDFFPGKKEQELVKNIFADNNKQTIKNRIDLPDRLLEIIFSRLKLTGREKSNDFNAFRRQQLLDLLKKFPLQIKALGTFDQAFVTSGGVALSEVDPRTMKSKVIDNLYLAGEVLDLDGPTGGYNLQVAWTTGFVAGSNF